MIDANPDGVETPGWLIALIGVVGVMIGGLITLWGNQMSASREERRRNQDRAWEERKRSQDRLWEAKRRSYEAVAIWIGKTQQALHDLHYSYTQYMISPPPATGEVPRVLLKKQREYRQVIPLDQWSIPETLGDEALTLLNAYATPEIAQIAGQAQNYVIRMADETRSLGRSVINMPNRSPADRAGADEVINGFYRDWLIASNRLLNMIRLEFDPEAKLFQLDTSQVAGWGELPERRRFRE